jgi:hypothetical protein
VRLQNPVKFVVRIHAGEPRNSLSNPPRRGSRTILPDDIITVPAKNLESMNVLMTLVGGKIVYQREDFRLSVTTGR